MFKRKKVEKFNKCKVLNQGSLKIFMRFKQQVFYMNLYAWNASHLHFSAKRRAQWGQELFFADQFISPQLPLNFVCVASRTNGEFQQNLGCWGGWDGYSPYRAIIFPISAEQQKWNTLYLMCVTLKTNGMFNQNLGGIGGRDVFPHS